MSRVVNEPSTPNGKPYPKAIGTVELTNGNELRAYATDKPNEVEIRHYWCCAPGILSWSTLAFLVSRDDLKRIGKMLGKST